MSAKTKIEWCDATWNPVQGCDPISPGARIAMQDSSPKGSVELLITRMNTDLTSSFSRNVLISLPSGRSRRISSCVPCRIYSTKTLILIIFIKSSWKWLITSAIYSSS